MYHAWPRLADGGCVPPYDALHCQLLFTNLSMPGPSIIPLCAVLLEVGPEAVITSCHSCVNGPHLRPTTRLMAYAPCDMRVHQLHIKAGTIRCPLPLRLAPSTAVDLTVTLVLAPTNHFWETLRAQPNASSADLFSSQPPSVADQSTTSTHLVNQFRKRSSTAPPSICAHP